MATALSIFAERLRKAYAAVGFGVRSSVTQADADVPTIKSGSAAPTATEPGGSLYMRTNGGLYTTVGGGTWVDPVASFADQLVTATVTVANATGGATAAALTLQLKRAIDHSTNIASARQVLITSVISGASEQYGPLFGWNPSSATFGTATVGSIIQSGDGWALVETSATGAFACTASNTVDETAYFSARTADQGISALTTRAVVVGSNSDAATWSA